MQIFRINRSQIFVMNKQFREREREELGREACQARFEKYKNAEKQTAIPPKTMVKTVEPKPRRNGPDIAAQWGRFVRQLAE